MNVLHKYTTAKTKINTYNGQRNCEDTISCTLVLRHQHPKLKLEFYIISTCTFVTYVVDILWAFTSLILFQQFVDGRPKNAVIEEAIANEVITYRESSNSSNPFSNTFSFLYCSMNALRFRKRSNWSIFPKPSANFFFINITFSNSRSQFRYISCTFSIKLSCIN